MVCAWTTASGSDKYTRPSRPTKKTDKKKKKTRLNRASCKEALTASADANTTDTILTFGLILTFGVSTVTHFSLAPILTKSSCPKIRFADSRTPVCDTRRPMTGGARRTHWMVDGVLSIYRLHTDKDNKTKTSRKTRSDIVDRRNRYLVYTTTM